MSFDFGAFEAISFDAERKANGNPVKVHRYLGPATTPVELHPPDLAGLRSIQKVVVDDSRRDRAPKIVDAEEKHFDWASGEHRHGGAIRVRTGDYIVCEDEAFFAVPEKLFSDLFRRL